MRDYPFGRLIDNAFRFDVNDTQLNTGGSGDKARTFDDGTRKHPASLISFGPTSDPGPIATPTVVDDANGKRFPVKVGDALPAGSNVMGGVTMADGASATLGAQADAAAAGDTSTASQISLFKRLLQRITTLLGLVPASLTGSGNFKVSLQESTASQAVTAASLPLPAGASTAAKQPALGTAGAASVDVITVQGIASGTAQPISAASLPLPTGAATEATLDARTGSLTESAPGTDTASSGLNGRLQRIAQRLTTFMGLFPAALTGSGNLKTAIVELTAALVAGTARIGGTYQVSGQIIDENGNVLTVKTFPFGVASSGTNDILTAVASRKLRVLGFYGVAASAVNIYFLDDTPTTLSGNSTNKIQLAANAGFVLPITGLMWFETASGKKLQVNLSAAVAFSGTVIYVEVP